MRKQVIVGIAGCFALIAGAAQAHADVYHRFWRGMKRADLASAQFDDGLNRIFIPATVETGQRKGMVAYEPVLTEGVSGLPDEVALVSYADKDAYDALYSTDAGKRYQNLHWQYFDHSLSHSVVPQPYAGGVAIDQAYDLDPSYSGWMKNTTTVLTYFRRAQETQPEFLARAKAHLEQALVADRQSGILDRVVLVSQDYMIEYASSVVALGAAGGADLVIDLKNDGPDTARISRSQGINLQF